MGEGIDAESLGEELTIWASPGVVSDVGRPDLGEVSVLTCVPSLSAHVRDEHPSAELVDVIATGLLAQGFALLTGDDPTTLTALPVVAGWTAQLSSDGRLMRVGDTAGALYDGDLGAAPPDGWHAALRRRGRVVVLVGSGIDLFGAGRTARIADARRAGTMVGAQVRLVSGE
jgi:hypothetical protein